MNFNSSGKSSTPGEAPYYQSPSDKLRGILCQSLPFDKMILAMLDPEMIEDTLKIVNEAIQGKVHVDLIINNRAGGNDPLIAQKIADRLHLEKQQRLF